VNLREYLRIARARWKVILGSVVATTAIAALLTLSTTPTYESSARLFFSTPQAEADVAFAGGEYSVERVASYADLVGSRQLAVGVVDRLGINAAPSDVSDQVSASATPGTANLQITAVDSDPVRARNIAQATAVQLAALVAELETPPGARNAPIKATVVDPATVSSTPISPSPSRNIALGLLLGLLLGLALAVVRELLDTTVRDTDDVEAATGLPVMSEIVHDARLARSPRTIAEGAQGPYVEALRVLRTSLQYVDVDDVSRVFTVTSSVSAEGKTTTATNLATMLARAGRRILLLEGDLRRPHMHHLLDVDPSVGLTTVLAGRVRMEEAVQDSGVPGLEVLTSGELPQDPAELLQSRAMAELIRRAREVYDVVVVDAPPLLPVTDAALLAALSDGALVVVRQGKTKREQLQLATKRLRAVGGRALGVVLNMTPGRLLGSQYYTYVDDQGTLSLLEDAEPLVPVSSAKRPGPIIATVHIPEQAGAPHPSTNGAVPARAGSAASRPGSPQERRPQVSQSRPEGVRDQVDRFRGPTGKKDRLGSLDQDRAGKPGGKPGQPAPRRPERRPKKT